MSSLSPKQTAAIAKHVYAVRQESDMQTVMELSGGLGIKDLFEVGKTSRMEGSSGPLLLSKKSGFGYVAKGIGQRQGEALIVLRGTVTARDWWTDANIGLQSGPGGFLVHAGFNDTYKSFHKDLSSGLKGFFKMKNPSHVHCVGHSLGGALATLVADYLSSEGIGAVSLYTYGCPRVGLSPFSKNLTRKIGADNIFRVYHGADPVSMIPIFPYFHIPDGDPGFQLDWPGSVAVSAHYMENYIRSLGDTSWGSLKSASASKDLLQNQNIKDWLRSASKDGFLMFSAKVLWMITKALGWILKKVATMAIGSVLTASVTILDRLAWLLYQGALACKEIAESLASLLKIILRFLGRVVSDVANLSMVFIRWVLDLLLGFVRNVAGRAVQAVFVG